MTSTNHTPLNTAVLGAGVIGVSWAALFAAHGHHVALYDISDKAFEAVPEQLEQNRPALAALGLQLDISLIRLATSLKDAAADAAVIQECGPDRVNIKQDLWQLTEQVAPVDALLLSSSSGITTGMQSKRMKNPERVIIGHPFNPPHLIPLVEVVGGKNTPVSLIRQAMDFYIRVGKTPVQLHKEVPGFVANRLQAALMREATLLVKWGVVDVNELDTIVTQSIGQRWAINGPFKSFHLAGGRGGFRHFLEQFVRGLQLLWVHSWISPVFFTPKVKQKLLKQIDGSFGRESISKLENERDQRQISLIKTLNTSGKSQRVNQSDSDAVAVVDSLRGTARRSH